MAQKVLSQERFHGGISSSEKEGPKYAFAFARSIDYRTDPRRISILPAATKESGSTVVDLPLWAETIGTDVYFYGDAGHIYKRTSAGSYSDLRTVSGSTGNGLGYFPEDDYLYYMRNTTLGRYGPISGTPTFTDDYLSQADAPTNTHSLDLELSSSQYASIADATQTGLDITGDLTIEAWIKLEQLPSSAGTDFVIVGKDNVGGARGYALLIQSSNDKLRFFCRNGADTANTVVDMDTAFVSGDVGTWIHVAVTVDISVPTVEFYKDGVSAASTVSTSGATDINNNAIAFYLGARESSGSPTDFFDGQLDDVRVWNDIRTSSEITDNYQKELVGTEANLQAYYKLNNAVTDSTSNSNDLTASGSPTYSANVGFSGSAVGDDRADIDQSLNTSGNTYTTPTAINEGATHRQSFVPAKDPQKSVEVLVAAVGTGDWTLTVHDSQNNEIASKTITNSNMSTGDVEFIFDSVWRPIFGKTYHFHVTSTVADGTVTTTTSADLETADFHTYYQFFVSDTYHPIGKFLNFLVLGNERYVAKWDGIVYEPHKLVLPSGYRVRCFAQIGEYLAIGTWRGDSITDFEQGKIFFWDGVSTSFNDQLDVPEGGINAMLAKQGKLYYWAGSAGDMFEYVGLSNKIKRVPKMTEDTYMEILPSSVTVWRSLIRFGVAGNSDNTSIEKGVYTWGSLDINYQNSLSYDYPISTGTRTGNNLYIGCVHSVGTNLFIGWRDDSSYGIDKVSPDNDPYSTATIELLIFDDDGAYKEKRAQGMKVVSKPLVSGESYTLKYKKDRASSWSSSGDALIMSTVGATDASLTIEPDDGRFKEFQMAVDMATTGSTSPTIVNISLLFDDLAEEDQILEENA